VNPRIRWGQAPTAWDAPGWAPLADPGPRPLHAAHLLGRWWWPTLTVAGFLAVVVQVLDHDPSALGLSYRGLLTVALAATVVALLTIHRRYGPRWLARALAEYATVALLATLLATSAGTIEQPAADHAPSGQPRAGQDQPAVIRAVTKGARAVSRAARAVAGAVRWLINLWHKADQQAAAKGQAMANPLPSPALSARSTWRFRA
jgi:hypothetical protein